MFVVFFIFAATKSRMERELAEAFLESEGLSEDAPSYGYNDELPSDSDSEHGDDMFSSLPVSTSLDTSLSLSAPSSMETSVLDESEVCM